MQTSILSAEEIRALCQSDKPMLTPFRESYRWKHESNPSSKGISGGLDYHGYVIHLGNVWVTFNPLIKKIDVANLDVLKSYEITTKSDELVLRPHHCILAVSEERFAIPTNVRARTCHKSTLARIGLDDIVTPLEPGWEGYLTIEVRNSGPLPIILRSGMPITQIEFNWVKDGVGYNGVYQNQPAVPVSALGNGGNQ